VYSALTSSKRIPTFPPYSESSPSEGDTARRSRSGETLALHKKMNPICSHGINETNKLNPKMIPPMRDEIAPAKSLNRPTQSIIEQRNFRAIVHELGNLNVGLCIWLNIPGEINESFRLSEAKPIASDR
jgi:hypothetical protein